MMRGKLAMAEDLEGAGSVVLVVTMAAERWRNRLESEFRRCIWSRYIIGNKRK
jgi:hypothetical protein